MVADEGSSSRRLPAASRQLPSMTLVRPGGEVQQRAAQEEIDSLVTRGRQQLQHARSVLQRGVARAADRVRPQPERLATVTRKDTLPASGQLPGRAGGEAAAASAARCGDAGAAGGGGGGPAGRAATAAGGGAAPPAPGAMLLFSVDGLEVFACDILQGNPLPRKVGAGARWGMGWR
jgi:hypothetical protein